MSGTQLNTDGIYNKGQSRCVPAPVGVSCSVSCSAGRSSAHQVGGVGGYTAE